MEIWIVEKQTWHSLDEILSSGVEGAFSSREKAESYIEVTYRDYTRNHLSREESTYIGAIFDDPYLVRAYRVTLDELC